MTIFGTRRVPRQWTTSRNAASRSYQAQIPTTEILDYQATIATLRRQLAASTARERDLIDRLYMDQLTGVRSRLWLQDCWLASQPAAILMIDLNGFKAVNDTHGHGVGDTVLGIVASRLASIPRSDTVRLGGDEYVLLMWHEPDTAGIVASVGGLIVEPIRIPDGATLTIGAAIGLVHVEAGWSAEDALRAADMIMYGDKHRQQADAANPCPDRRKTRR